MSGSSDLPAIDLRTIDPWLLAAGAVLLGVLVGVIGVFGWRAWRARRERRARAALIASVSLDHARDVVVLDGNGGTLHLDYLLLTPRGLVVLEMRDAAGNVFGSDAMTEWTVMDGPRRYTFANPQASLYDRIAAVKAQADDIPVEGRVVFTRRANFPKGLPRLTLREDSLGIELLMGDRDHAERAVEPWRGTWQRLRAELRPSGFSGVG
ncbi:MAG: nuclease-related domain-containing protein [Gammaproteobacteria bacterium]